MNVMSSVRGASKLCSAVGVWKVSSKLRLILFSSFFNSSAAPYHDQVAQPSSPDQGLIRTTTESVSIRLDSFIAGNVVRLRPDNRFHSPQIMQVVKIPREICNLLSCQHP